MNMNDIPITQISYQHYLSEDEIKAIEYEIAIMETTQAAGIEALKIVQSHRGWISDDSLFAIADMLQMPVAQLEGVATFYNLIYRQPVGKHVIHLCNSIACHLLNYQKISQTLTSYLSIEFGQTTSDGEFTLLTNACLGGCDKAPVMMIGNKHYEHLTPERVVDILQTLNEVGGHDE